MDIKVNRPSDPYDVEGWLAYYEANNVMFRSVGAAGDDEGDQDEGGESDDPKGSEDAPKNKEDAGGASNDDEAGDDPVAKLEALKAQLAKTENEKADLLKETMSRKDKLKAAEAEKSEAAEQLAQMQSQLEALFDGEVNLDDLQTKIEEKKRVEEENLRRAGEFDKLKDRMAAEQKKEVDRLNGEHGAKVKDLQGRLDTANSEIRRLLVTNSFASSKFLAEELNLSPAKAEKLYGDSFKVEEVDGRMAVRAYNGDEPLADSNGNFMSFEDAFRAIVEADPDKDVLFKSKAKPGAGSGSEGKAPPPVSKEAPRGVDAIRAGLANKN